MASNIPPLHDEIDAATAYEKLEYVGSMLQGLSEIVRGTDNEVYALLKAAYGICYMRVATSDIQHLSEMSEVDRVDYS